MLEVSSPQTNPFPSNPPSASERQNKRMKWRNDIIQMSAGLSLCGDEWRLFFFSLFSRLTKRGEERESGERRKRER